MLVVPFGRRRLLGVVVDLADESELPPERLAEPLSALEANVPAPLVRLGLWLAREYCSAPARGLALVLPPGTGTGSGRPLTRRSSLRASLTEAGSVADGGGLGERQLAALRALADGPLGVADLARRAGIDHAVLRRLERRGLVDLTQAAAPSRRPHLERVGAPAGGPPPSHSGADGGTRGGRGADGHGRRRATAVAPRGHRQRQDRGLPPVRRDGARARPLGDRARARDRADAADRRALRRALRRPRGGGPLPSRRARAVRRVVANAQWRGAGSAWGRARRCSPRSTTSA